MEWSLTASSESPTAANSGPEPQKSILSRVFGAELWRFRGCCAENSECSVRSALPRCTILQCTILSLSRSRSLSLSLSLSLYICIYIYIYTVQYAKLYMLPGEHNLNDDEVLHVGTHSSFRNENWKPESTPQWTCIFAHRHTLSLCGPSVKL